MVSNGKWKKKSPKELSSLKEAKYLKNNMEQILAFLSDNQLMVYLVILMVFLGIELIEKVPSVLHTPLMSGANAIHGVVIIGAIIIMGQADNLYATILGF